MDPAQPAKARSVLARRVVLIVGVVTLVPLLVATQRWLRLRADSESSLPVWAQEAAKRDLAELAEARTELARYHALGDAALANLEFGNLEAARAQAEELDRLRLADEGSWNHGNAIADVNVVLGRLALRAGDVAQAKRKLLAAGRSPGSPQMDTFGPNMSLARDLLLQGERDVVLEYFSLCRRFWKMHRGRLDEWAGTVGRGEMPDFGGNLF